MTKSRGILHRYTPEEDKFINDNFLLLTYEEIAKKINRTIGSLYSHTKLLGLVIPEEIAIARRKKTTDNLLVVGKPSRFKKGIIPFNKDKKMSKELKERIKYTFFKPGNIPANTLYNGAIVFKTDKKTGIKYKNIRIALAKWIPLHIYNWEKVNGPVPKGKILAFKTKSHDNCEIENLELITREENMLRNTIHRYPEEVQKSIRTLGKLTKIIRKEYEKQ